MARALAAVAALVSVPGAAAALLAGERELHTYSFQHYVQEFGKAYTSEEFKVRQQIFESNLRSIREHNSNDDKTWFAAPNKFTDWTNEEFRARRVTGKRPRVAKHLLKSAAPPANVNDLPATVDWRQKAGVLTPVKDQGGCGSCWAFSAAATMESMVAIATGQSAPVLSPQQLVSCAPNPQQCGGTGGCSGSTQELGFNYTQTAGLGLESTYPYVARTGTCDQSKVKPVAINDGFVQLTTNSYTELATAVATQGPIAISLAAGGFSFQIYGGGILSNVNGCGWDVDHAVQLVGYGSENGKDYWIVRNSWGPGWGEGGFIRIQRFGEGQEPCGTDKTPQDGDACAGDTAPRTVCGVCAILSDSSYPTGVRSVAAEPSLVV